MPFSPLPRSDWNMQLKTLQRSKLVSIHRVRCWVKSCCIFLIRIFRIDGNGCGKIIKSLSNYQLVLELTSSSVAMAVQLGAV